MPELPANCHKLNKPQTTKNKTWIRTRVEKVIVHTKTTTVFLTAKNKMLHCRTQYTQLKLLLSTATDRRQLKTLLFQSTGKQSDDYFVKCHQSPSRWGNIAHTRPFNGPFSGTNTRVSRYEKGKTNLNFTEARDSEWLWHQLGYMQVCTSFWRDIHASTPPLSFLQAGCPSCRPTNSVKALKAI